MTPENLEAIRALVMRYNIGGDRGRVEELASCFASDGVLEFPRGTGRGPEGIVAALKSGTAHDRQTLSRHHLTTMQILPGPNADSATGRIYFLGLADNGLDHSGVYVDRYRKEGGEWRIALRQVRIDWQAETSVLPPMVTR